MKIQNHKTAVWLIAIAAIVAAVVLLLWRTGVGESVKRESARLFDYEYIPNQNVDIDRCEAAGMADSIYKDFRKKYRFHYQTVGMASFSDSSRMILLSDIPPHFETDSIAPIFAQFKHKTEQRKHSIGYDGYTTDLIILLGNATQENCDRLIKRLNRELFFSEYKPTVMKLPAEEKRRYFAKENIDYQITLEEFNTWFMEEGEGFIRLDDTNTVLTISDIFAKKARGVFFSQQPGFVAWALAKNADLLEYEEYGHPARHQEYGHLARVAVDGQDARTPFDGQDARTPIRQFTLDADLILGALADSSTLVKVLIDLVERPPLTRKVPGADSDRKHVHNDMKRGLFCTNRKERRRHERHRQGDKHERQIDERSDNVKSNHGCNGRISKPRIVTSVLHEARTAPPVQNHEAPDVGKGQHHPHRHHQGDDECCPVFDRCDHDFEQLVRSPKAKPAVCCRNGADDG